MSAYKDFVSDYPKRCAELLNLTQGAAKVARREVTLLLAIATTALGVPFERLKADGKFPHPAKNNQQFAAKATALAQLQKEDFCGSALWPSGVPSSWCMGDLATVNGEPDLWPELNKPAPVGPNIKVKAVLHALRNALAHGNLWTKGKEISQLVFVTRQEGKQRTADFTFIQVSPLDLQRLLKNWIKFLGSI